MAYRADIEIAVRGAQELKRLQNEISATSKLIVALNNYIENIGSGGVVRSINNLQDTVQKAAKAFNEAALNTEEATIAAKKYIDATNDLNAGLRERQVLLKSINEEERKNRLSAIGREVGGRPSAGYAGPIGPGMASPIGALVGQQSPVAERIQRTIKGREDEVKLQQALLRLEEKSAAELNKKVQSQEALVQGTREVLQLIQQQANKTKFLAGASGASVQGPLPPLTPIGATGFPVALPMTKAEQLSLELNNKKQQILERTVATRKQLAGLAENLQRLDLNSSVAIADAERAQQELNAAKEKTVRLSERDLAIAKQGAVLAGRFSPIGGAENIPGSPAARRAQAARRREALSNAVIGGAFPLLFGQGPGAALGGGFGGAAGGLAGGQFGFGLSLVGTALGAAVDTFTKAAIESGKSLRDPVANFQKLADAGLIASRSQQKYIERLIEAGRVTEAATAIQQEIINKIGVQGVKDLQNAGAASDKLNKALAELSLQAQAAVAGPLAGLLSWLASVVAIGNSVTSQAAQQTDIMQGLSTQDRQSLKAQEQSILRGANIFNEAQKRQQVEQLYQRYASRANVQQPGTSTDKTPELQAQAATRELAAQVQLEAQKLTLAGMSLEKDGQSYVAATKRLAQQEYENKLLEIKNYWIGKAFDGEKNQLMIRQANLQLAQKNKEADRQYAAQAARQQEELLNARLQAEMALYRQAEQNLLFQVKLGQYVNEERGGAEALLKYYTQIYQQRLAALNVEQEVALREAARNGTTEEVIKLYKYKVDLLNAEAGLEQAVAKLTLERLDLQKAINKEKALEETIRPFTEFRREQELQNQSSQTYLRLLTEGMLPAEAERIVNFERLVKEQTLYIDDQIKAVERQLVLTEATITEAKARGAAVDKLKEELDLLKQRRDAIVGEAAKGPGAGKTNRERLQDEIAIVQGQLNTLLDPINQITTAAEGIGLAFSDSFKGIVSGTMTAQEALAGFFQSVADQFLDMAAQIIAKWIQLTILNSILKLFPAAGAAGGSAGLFGAGAPDAIAGGGIFSGAGPYQFRANGGPVSAGSPYIVGERGPELFVPGRSGTIVPNDKMGGDNVNVVVNVDAKGTSVQGNDQQGNQLGRAISAAVQQELIKQKRPGGLLA